MSQRRVPVYEVGYRERGSSREQRLRVECEGSTQALAQARKQLPKGTLIFSVELITAGS